jgi:endonuclease/exonuclease/phosphatase (EEP) superfamily protein YafD
MTTTLGNLMRKEISWWGVPAAAGMIVCGMTMCGFLGRLWWVFDNLSQFRMHYALSLAALAIIFAFGRRRTMALVLAGFAAANLAVVLPYCYIGRSPGRSNGPIIRVALANVETANQRYELVEAFVRRIKPDVLILEEVDDGWMKQLEKLREELPHCCAMPRCDNLGIALFSKLPFTNSSIRELGPTYINIPSVIAEIEVGQKKLMVMGTHPLPPTSEHYARLRNEQLDAIAGFIAKQRIPLIFAGDLNTTPWSHVFSAFVKKSGLRDSARGRGYKATWPAVFGELGIPLDHCLVSDSLQIVNRQRGPNVGSDHLPLIIDIQIPE